MVLIDNVKFIKGVGDALAKKLGSLGIVTIADLFDYYPRAYEDYSVVQPINKIKPGNVSLRVTISNAKGRYVRKRMHITEAIASDETGSVRLIWFNQPYRAASIKSGSHYFLSGPYELKRGRFTLSNPNLELASDLPVNAGRILAVYKETKGIDSRQIRKVVGEAIDATNQIEETLPEWLLSDSKLINRSKAIRSLHMPESTEDLETAKWRLGFEEVFELSLTSLINKQANKAYKSLGIKFDEDLAKDFVKHLPFQLTDDQRINIWQIYKDLAKTEPMNRLIEGDVGSGKTVVATMAALMVIHNGYQAALMAPTELLARQHADTIYKLLEPLGYQDKITLLIGSMNAKQKAEAQKSISEAKAGFVIGTQALIQDKVSMKSLALAIIDEQHRFGVGQRKTLMSKAGLMPHVLSLSATPIPRSLALTLYGELDISLLKNKPKERKPIITKIVYPGERVDLYKHVDQEITDGRQVFVVCPSIVKSTTIDAKSVEEAYDELSKGPLKHRKLGLLHGKLAAQDKQEIMQKFLDKKIDILVSTTVIEVGVDVPNATTMLILSPERFGLAQLHQLRGRVGRSSYQGYCYLVLDSTEIPFNRLRALVSSSDGFKLADLDLELRGPGAIYGTMQHGALDLRIARLTDSYLISAATTGAKEFIERKAKLKDYPKLDERINKLMLVTNLN